MKNFNSKRSFNYLKNITQTVVGLLIFYLIFSYFKKEITSLDFKKIYLLTLQLGNVKFFFVIFCGLLGITILCLYDYFVLKAINLTKSMSSFRIFKISYRYRNDTRFNAVRNQLAIYLRSFKYFSRTSFVCT